MNLVPEANDLLVIPEDMELTEAVPCPVHRMKYLHQPSIIRSGGYNMNSVNDISISTIARWLGRKVDDFLVKPLKALGATEAEFNMALNSGTPEGLSGFEVLVAEQELRELPTFYRHFRCYRGREYYDGLKTELLAKGGMTLYVELNPAEKTLAFSYSLCNTADNFDKNLGRLISKGRFEGDDWYEVANCQDSLDVVGNIASALYQLLYNPPKSDTIQAETKGPYFSSMSEKFKVQDMKQIFERLY